MIGSYGSRTAGINIHGPFIETVDPCGESLTLCLAELGNVVDRDYILFALLGGYEPSDGEADEYPACMVSPQNLSDARLSASRAMHLFGSDDFIEKWNSSGLLNRDIACHSPTSLTIEEVRAVAHAYRKATGLPHIGWSHTLEFALIIAKWVGDETQVRVSFCFGV